ncbi:MAG: methyltransferase domain-containing protein [Acidobacteria bacterium]|nr:MAG: methyltransferase domain-containing protein [Acidobacteriota bacterium]
MNKGLSDPVDEIASGYKASQILLTANRLGLFTALGKGPLSAAALAAEMGTDPRATRILCDALASLELLDKTNGVYSNSELAAEFLLPDSPKSRSAMLLHAAKLYERWSKLYDVVRTGQPVPEEEIDSRLRGDGRDFARAMADVGRLAAESACEVLDLTGVRRLLDVGGGPGVYALAFAGANPELQAVILDSPETLEVAAANIARQNLRDRVSVRTGDAFVDDLGGPYDFIFISNLLHIYSKEANRKLLVRCAEALEPGGRLAVKDFLLDPDRLTPAGGAVFAVNMLVSTEGGDSYTAKEVQQWLEDAGLVFESLENVATHSRILVARKPQA